MRTATANENRIQRVHRCKVHDFRGNTSWFQLIGICHCVHASCKTESDGYHEHKIRFGDDAWSRAVIVDELHSWMEDGETYVQIQRGKDDYRAGSDIVLGDAWKKLAADFDVDDIGDLPPFPCLLTT